MNDTAWLILAVAVGLVAAFLWVQRELWVIRRRRKRPREDR
jgi:hypothetical protein